MSYMGQISRVTGIQYNHCIQLELETIVYYERSFTPVWFFPTMTQMA